MPQLVRFFLVHAAIGFSLAIAFIATLMFFNVNGLWTLIWGSDQRYLALFILTFFSGLTFGSVQISVAVMLLGEENQGGGTRSWLGRIAGRINDWIETPAHRALVPVPVKKAKR